MKHIWPSIKWSIKNRNKRFKESNLLKLNCNKAKKIIKWNSILSFKENIKMTIDWYRSFYTYKNLKIMKKFSENQIIEFTKLIEKRSIR